ncbi:MAG: N-acetyltransferase family protein [Myxococcales bacterium]
MPVLLRPIRPDDAPLLEAGLLQLSERTRYLRFHSPRKELSAGELRSLTEVDGEAHLALTAFALHPEQLVAVGRFIRSAAEPVAELALVVGDPLQGKGLGRVLLSRLWQAAVERNIERFEGVMLEENLAVRALLRKAGARIGLPSRGVCEFVLPLTNSRSAQR